MNNSNEIWQVDAGGQIYETSFEEMTNWIAEGSLLPQDKVRRGNLRWIEAQKVPSLYGFFNAKELGTAPPIVTTTSGHSGEESQQVQNFSVNSFPPPQNFNEPPPPQLYQELTPQVSNNFCAIHNDAKAEYHCETCTNYFCRACPNHHICPMCGAMCKALNFPAVQPTAFKPQPTIQPIQDNLIDPDVRKGAHWFYWKAALTVVNSFIGLTGTFWAFFLGLGITQIFQGIAIGVNEEMGTSGVNAISGVAFVLSLICAGFVLFLGFQAAKAKKWAFILGIVIFSFDALLYLITLSIFGVIIHGIAIFMLAKGLSACKK